MCYNCGNCWCYGCDDNDDYELPGYGSINHKKDYYNDLPEPVADPIDPVRDIGGTILGHRDRYLNSFKPLSDPMPMDIGPGGFIRDPLGNTIGEIGPGNTLLPPPRIGF